MFPKLWVMLQTLENETGKNAKKDYIKEYIEDPDFVWMVKSALDQGHSYGINEFPEFTNMPASNPVGTQYAALKVAIDNLKEANGVSAADIEYLHRLACTSEDSYNVATRIMRKDLRCGVGASTINSVKKKTVHVIPYQRCGSGSEIDKFDFKHGAILQRKANGMFTYLMPNGVFTTRQGETSTIPGNVVAPFISSLPGLCDRVNVMELTVLDYDGKTVDRAIGNGLINSFFQGSGDPDVAPRIRAHIWLSLTMEEYIAEVSRECYKAAWGCLNRWLPLSDSTGKPAPVKLIESWYVKTKEEARAKTMELIAADEEGGVLKSLSPDFVWKSQSSSKLQLKLKAEATCEFEVISAYPGDSKKKYAGMLGGITIRSKCGKIVSDCGGGFSDKQRQLPLEHWPGKIVSVTFNGLTLPNLEGISALDHPRFDEDRSLEKSEADTLEYCKDALKGRIK